ncbi:hypothetical protein Acr_18g0009270 [Actinidia rufa]|uniref:Uncharacterized protein n=1 Tax=Actinidia rufa TaxID=165716 RepID=A0A7J0G7J1_9ERIC|nr:hypothetical protein Acr_18g0009270 [Actinidia rufa]
MNWPDKEDGKETLANEATQPTGVASQPMKEAAPLAEEATQLAEGDEKAVIEDAA